MKEILECVDRALDSLGTNIRIAIYHMLESNSRVKKSSILSDPDKFVRSLEVVFGDGSLLVERLIMEELRSEFNLSATTLPDAIRQAESKVIGNLKTS